MSRLQRLLGPVVIAACLTACGTDGILTPDDARFDGGGYGSGGNVISVGTDALAPRFDGGGYGSGGIVGGGGYGSGGIATTGTGTETCDGGELAGGGYGSGGRDDECLTDPTP